MATAESHLRFQTHWVPQHSKNPRRAVSWWTAGRHSVYWADYLNSRNLGPEAQTVLGELQVSFPDGKLRKLLSGKESAGQQIRKTQKGKAKPAASERFQEPPSEISFP